MSRSSLVGLCAFALVAGATLSPAVASEKTEKQVTPAAKTPVPPAAKKKTPSPAALDYARRYAKAINLDSAMAQMMEAIMPLAIEAEIAHRPDLTEKEKTALHEAASEAGAAISPRFADVLAVKMAAIFSEEELRSLAEFYESPIGRSIAAKEGALTKAGEEAAEEIVPEFGEDMVARLCRKIDCSSSTARPTRTQS